MLKKNAGWKYDTLPVPSKNHNTTNLFAVPYLPAVLFAAMTSSPSRKRACTHLHDDGEVVSALKRKIQDNATSYIICNDDNDDSDGDGDDNDVGNKCVNAACDDDCAGHCGDCAGTVDSIFRLDDHAPMAAMYNDTVQFDSFTRDDASSLSLPSDSDSDSLYVPDDFGNDVDSDADDTKGVECHRCHTVTRHVYPLADEDAAGAAGPEEEQNQSDTMHAVCDAATAAFVPDATASDTPVSLADDHAADEHVLVPGALPLSVSLSATAASPSPATGTALGISKPIFICRRCRHVIVVVEVPSPAGTLHIPLTNFNDLSSQQQTIGALLEHMNVDFAADAAAVAVGTYVTYSTVTGGSQSQFEVDRKRSAYLQRHDVADKRVSTALYDNQYDDADDVSDVYVDLSIRREAWSMTAAVVDTIARRMKDMV
jgi:hypothetical protein